MHISYIKTGMTVGYADFYPISVTYARNGKKVKKGRGNKKKFYINKVATKEGVPEWTLTDKSKRGGKINEYRGNYGIKMLACL